MTGGRGRSGAGEGPAEAELLHGKVLEAAGDLAAAAERYRAAAALQPARVEPHFHLGRLQLALGQAEAALASFRRAAGLAPGNADVHNNLGMALKRLGRLEGAAAALRRAAALQPTAYLAHCNLGNVLAEAGQAEAAVAAYEAGIAANPKYAFPYANIARVRRGQGKLQAAADYARRAVAADPASAQGHSELGQVHRARGEHEQAIACLQRALELEPGKAGRLYDLANACRAAGRPDEAIAHYRRALAIDPKHADAWNRMGMALQESGDVEGSRAAFRRCLDLAPKDGFAHGNLARVTDYRGDEPHLREMQALADDASLPDAHRIPLLFALGKACEDAGDAAKAFDYLHAGNRLKRGTIRFDLQAELDLNERMIETFDRAFFDLPADATEPSAVPIVVVGVARSGTTLVEQILASHSRVRGAGETGYLQTLLADWVPRLRDGSFPRRAGAIGADELRRRAARYVAQLQRHDPAAAHIVDKSLFNFRLVGLIRAMLPNARIVHCVRDPVDACLSSYKKLFRTGVLYSYDLEELGRYYVSYRRLMAHWRAVLPEAMLEFRYEDLVADQAGKTRELLAWCDLPWEDSCLAFHRTGRAIDTASLVQVRRPIYSSAVGSARRHHAYIRPLLAALGIEADGAGTAS